MLRASLLGTKTWAGEEAHREQIFTKQIQLSEISFYVNEIGSDCCTYLGFLCSHPLLVVVAEKLVQEVDGLHKARAIQHNHLVNTMACTKQSDSAQPSCEQ